MSKKKNKLTLGSINDYLKVLPNPSEMLKTKSATMAIYHKVAKHHDILPVSQSYKDSICKMKQNCNDDFMQAYLKKYKGAIKQLKRDMVAARDYGYSVIQILEYETFQGKTVPSKFQLCPPEWFRVGSDMELRYVDTKTGVNGIDLFETYPNKFLWITNEQSLVHPYGISLLDTIYWVAVGLNGNFDAMIDFAEYDGSDKWIGYYRPGATEEEKTNLLSELVKLKAHGVTIAPSGTNINLIENKGRTSTSGMHKDNNEMLLRKVEKLWFGTDLTMQVDGKGGYSSSQTGVDIREEALQLGADMVADGLLQLYKIITDINGMTAKDDIEISLESPHKITKEEAEVDQIYINAGLKPKQQFFENRGYNPDEFEYTAPNTQPINPMNSVEFSADNLADIFDVYKDNLPK